MKIDNTTYVGAYVMGKQFHYSLTFKPCWLHRFMTRILLGWVWSDYNDRD